MRKIECSRYPELKCNNLRQNPAMCDECKHNLYMTIGCNGIERQDNWTPFVETSKMNCKVGNIVRIKSVAELEKATNVNISAYANKLTKIYDVWEDGDRYYLEIDDGVYGFSDLTVDRVYTICTNCGSEEATLDEADSLCCNNCNNPVEIAIKVVG